jgi:hypothetical protein
MMNVLPDRLKILNNVVVSTPLNVTKQNLDNKFDPLHFKGNREDLIPIFYGLFEIIYSLIIVKRI